MGIELIPPDENSRLLMLVRHSAVKVEKQKPAIKWSLSSEGRERCRQFAPLIAPFRPTLFVTSLENKAIETGRFLAGALDVPVASAGNLHEPDRQGVPFLGSQPAFRRAIGRFFASPDQLVFGRETAEQAADRFDSAIVNIIEQHQGQNIAVVAHGTVITLFVNRYNTEIDPLSFWDNLQMPCAVLMHLPNMAFNRLILPASGGYKPSQ